MTVPLVPPSERPRRQLLLAVLVGALVGGPAAAALLGPRIGEARRDCVDWAVAVGAEAHARSARGPEEPSAAIWAERIRSGESFLGVDAEVRRPAGCR